MLTLVLFLENYIDGEEFLSLTESEIKSMVPPIGLTRKISRLIPRTEVRLVASLDGIGVVRNAK